MLLCRRLSLACLASRNSISHILQQKLGLFSKTQRPTIKNRKDVSRGPSTPASGQNDSTVLLPWCGFWATKSGLFGQSTYPECCRLYIRYASEVPFCCRCEVRYLGVQTPVRRGLFDLPVPADIEIYLIFLSTRAPSIRCPHCCEIGKHLFILEK